MYAFMPLKLKKYALTLGLPNSESNELIPRWGQKWPHKKKSYFLEILTNLDEIFRLNFQTVLRF